MDGDVLNFIRSAKQHGIADEFVVSLLRHNGWPERRIFRAFSSYYSETMGVAMPARAGSIEHARDAFLYLLNFITLGFWTVALGQIWYQLIARWFPDVQSQYYVDQSLRDAISGQIATVIVTFPIFLFVHSLIQQELRKRRDLYDSGIRKWLTYIALVIAALVVLGDAIWFLTSLLRGELTVRFILDSIVLLVLGGGVFAYYLATINPPAERE
ncbi:MAG TPA: DUF5671 domain-containing protein [Candidatus Baltobacteraceae bacterium]|nr:DUF5671 domain-containing protein [Candidatus Baltobacteraceae bacterium]